MMYTSVFQRRDRTCAYRTLLGVSVLGLSFYFVIYEIFQDRIPAVIYPGRAFDDPGKLARYVLGGNESQRETRDGLWNITSGKSQIPRVSDEPCTFALFRRYFETYNYFPGSGNWSMGIKAHLTHFQPDFCKFRHHRMKSATVAQCLADSKVKSIMTLGDSNAHRYFNAVRRSIANINECHVARAESLVEDGYLPDKKYYQPTNKTGNFSEWEDLIEVDYRYCRGCRSEQQICSVSVDPVYEVKVEHLSMDLLLDGSVEIRVRSKKQMAKLRQHWSPTAQETLFKHFLKGRYPDIFLMFLPFNHAKHLPSARLRLDLQYFLGLVRYYLPKDTRVVFMTTFSEFEQRRTIKTWINATFEGLLATDKIDQLNHMLFDLAREDFRDPHNRIYGFLDLIDVSKPRMSWSFDGVHMDTLWYDNVMSMLWETYCNSLRLEEF